MTKVKVGNELDNLREVTKKNPVLNLTGSDIEPVLKFIEDNLEEAARNIEHKMVKDAEHGNISRRLASKTQIQRRVDSFIAVHTWAVETEGVSDMIASALNKIKGHNKRTNDERHPESIDGWRRKADVIGALSKRINLKGERQVIAEATSAYDMEQARLDSIIYNHKEISGNRNDQELQAPCRRCDRREWTSYKEAVTLYHHEPS